MYIRANTGLGISQQSSNCSGWEKDPQSFTKVIAEHYVRTELGRSLRGRSIWCRPDGKMCTVGFPGGIEVMVSLVRVPSYVIARQIGKDKPRREYRYVCLPQGGVVFWPRS
jgi:hypothetical protein